MQAEISCIFETKTERGDEEEKQVKKPKVEDADVEPDIVQSSENMNLGCLQKLVCSALCRH